VVAFAYEERPDPVTVFIGGYGASTLYRLRQVSVWRDAGAPAHCYDFEYACGTATRLSRLSSITERGAPDPARSYLPLISVSWQDTPSPGFDIGTPVALQAHARTLDFQSIDISGNGCTDLVHFWLDERDVLHATSYLADTAGTFSSGVVSTLGAFPPDRQVLPADLDGDGRVDLLVAYRHPGTGNLVLAPFLSNGAAFEALTEHDTGDQYCADHLGFYAMDVNGDGRTDLVEAYAHSDPQRGKLLYFRSYLSLLDGSDTQLFAPAQVSATPDPAFTARQFALLPMDVNGDGMIDLVRVWADGPTDEVHVTAYLAVATAIDSVTFAVRRHTSLGVLDPGSQCAFLPVDINGDGIMDLLRVWEEASDEGPVLHLASLISNGAGGFVNGPDSRFPGRSFDPDGFYPIGFSGGGQTQVLNTWSTEDGERMLAVYAPSPSGLFRLITEQHAGVAGAPACGERVLVGDVNGDGKADLVCVGADGEGLPAAQVYLSRGPYPDLVSRVRDHHGAVTTIDYAPLSDSSIYVAPRPADFPESAALRYPAALSPGQFPVEGVLGQAVYVVAQYTQRHPAGCYGHNPIRHFSFSYADARVDLLDRGWLGFREVRLVNP
jgi:hypothetical protein